MARRLDFEKTFDDGVHTYRYMSEEGLFKRSWAGLDCEWSESGPTPFTEYGVNNSHREEFPVYLGLIWRLTSGLRRFGVPRYHREAGLYGAGEPYALIDWELDVETVDDGEPGRIRGFVPARSSVRVHPSPGPWQRENAARAGLFELPAFNVFKDVVRRLLGDAVGQLNLYAVVGEPRPTTATLMAAMRAPMPLEVSVRGEALAAALRTPAPPQMAAVLAPGEVFADLTIGVDLGYADIIVVQTLTEIDDVLVPLVREYDAAIEAYEAEVDEIADTGEFIERLGRLLALENS